MNLAPVVLFVYNRLDHTRKTIESLKKNKFAGETELFVFSDYAKTEKNIPTVKAVRNYINTIAGFKAVNIVEREKNFGLAKSIIDGVTSVINKYEKIIVLEDDLITSIDFLNYMNQSLEFYKDKENIHSIAGYSPPIKIDKDYVYDTYLIPTRSASWGWATWKNIWEKVDWEIKDFSHFEKDMNARRKFDLMGTDMTKMLVSQMNGEINSWSIRFDYHHFKNNAYAVYPIKSKILNIGMDASGTHSEITDEYNVQLDNESKSHFNFALEPDDVIIKETRYFYNSLFKFKSKLKRKIKHVSHKLNLKNFKRD